MQNTRTLDQFPAGSTVKITGMCDCRKVRARLCAMGLTPGTTVVVDSNGSGPRRLNVRGSSVVLGQGLCCKILCCPADSDDDSAQAMAAPGHCTCGDHFSGRR